MALNDAKGKTITSMVKGRDTGGEVFIIRLDNGAKLKIRSRALKTKGMIIAEYDK